MLQLVESCDEILVLEDGQPFVEKQLKGYLGIGIKVKGRLGRHIVSGRRTESGLRSTCSRKRK